MEFVAGAFHLSARIQSCKSHVGYEYFEDHGTHGLSRSIDLSGTILPYGERGAHLLIEGTKPLSGLPIGVSVRIGRPSEFGAMTDRQSRHLADMPHRPPINQAIGFAQYHEAITDQETRATLEEGLFVEVVVEEWVLNDLWSAVRVPGLLIRQISLGLFGENLLEVDEFRGITYHWLRHQTGRFGPIYVADFRYTTETVHSR
jgi:hypothetical protein